MSICDTAYLLYYEVLKLIKQKAFLWILLAALLSDIFLVYIQYTTDESHSVDPVYRTQVQEEIENMSLEDSVAYLSYELDLCERITEYSSALELTEIFDMPNITQEEISRYQEYENNGYVWSMREHALKELAPYYKQLSAYPQYLDNIEKKTEALRHSPLWNTMTSAKQKDTLVLANSYQKLRGTILEPIEYRGMETYIHAMGTKLVCLILAYSFAILILKEDEEDAFGLLLSTKNGHRTTAIAKLFTFVLISFVSIVLLQALTIGWHMLLYGGCRLDAHVQSLPSLYESNTCFTIGQWLLISTITFACAITMLATVFLFLYHICYHKLVSFVSFFGFCFIEAIVYTVIPETSYLIGLSHINILRLLEGTFIGKCFTYQHIFFFRIPTNIFILICCIILALLFSLLYIFLYHHKLGRKRNALPSITITATNIWIQESHRILFTNKAIIILLVLTAIPLASFAYRSSSEDTKYRQASEQRIAAIYQTYEGDVTEDTIRYISIKMRTYAEQEVLYQQAKAAYKKGTLTYDEWQDAYMHYERNMEGKDIYQSLYTLIERNIPYLVYNQGFSTVFGIYMPNRDAPRIAFLMVGLLLLISTTAYHSQEEALYLTTCKGKSRRKHAVCIQILCLSLGMVVISEVCAVLYDTQLYPMNDFHVTMDILYQMDDQQAIPYISSLTAEQYVWCLAALRLFAAISLCIIAMGIFRLTKHRIIGLLLCLLIFFFPMFLYYNGFTFFSAISLFDVLMGNLFFHTTFSLVKLLIIAGIDFLFVILINKSYGNPPLLQTLAKRFRHTLKR